MAANNCCRRNRPYERTFCWCLPSRLVGQTVKLLCITRPVGYPNIRHNFIRCYYVIYINTFLWQIIKQRDDKLLFTCTGAGKCNISNNVLSCWKYKCTLRIGWRSWKHCWFKDEPTVGKCKFVNIFTKTQTSDKQNSYFVTLLFNLRELWILFWLLLWINNASIRWEAYFELYCFFMCFLYIRMLYGWYNQ